MPCLVGMPGVAFRTPLLRRHLEAFLSRLNTRPARTSVNASMTPSRTPPHDSRPLWLAKPSTYDSFIHYTLPVYPGAQRIDHEQLNLEFDGIPVEVSAAAT
jgi:hypothetical protein